MTGPIILVTRDSLGRTVVAWYEDENGCLANDPLATLVAAYRLEAGRNIPVAMANRIADTWVLLLQVPSYDMSYLATHTLCDGALVPVPEVAA